VSGPDHGTSLDDVIGLIERQLCAYKPYIRGNALPGIAVLKYANAQDAAGDVIFSQAVDDALEKAFVALGWGSAAWCGILLSPSGGSALEPEGLRLLLETVDPSAIVAIDEKSLRALIRALSSSETGLLVDLTIGGKSYVHGRLVVSVNDFEGALNNERTKQIAWRELQQCKPYQAV
jgi:hypothetical protein